MATLEEALKMLDSLTTELLRRQTDVWKFDAYYRGEHKLHYASSQFRDYFAQRYVNFADNWCQVVADAPVERLEVTGITIAGDSPDNDKQLWEAWRRSEADHTSDEVFLEAIIGKRGYGLVWGDSDELARITFEHPSQAIVGYDPETGRRRAGLKLWVDQDTDLEYATLYLPDEIWKWQRPRVPQPRTDSGLQPVVGGIHGWQPREVASETWPLHNPLGEVPLVELPNKPRLLGEPISDIAGAVAMQDAINLLWAYLFNAADFASFPQRVILGQEKPTLPILDEDGNEVGRRAIDLDKFAVDRVVWLEDPDAKVAEWSAANLAVYTGVIESAVSHLAAQSRTPPHYMLLGKGLVNIAAEGMKVAETGLAMRSREKTKTFGRGIREIFRLTALIEANQAKADAVALGHVLWSNVEVRSDAQAVDAAQKERAMGLPLRWILEDTLNKTPDEVDRIMEMVTEESDAMLGVKTGATDEPPPPEA